MILRRALCLGFAAACVVGFAWEGPRAEAGDAQEIEAGRRIYEEGVLLSGGALRALRGGGVTLTGKSAACVHCHRRSGMGSIEGGRVIPPVAGMILFSVPVKPARRNPPDSITVVEPRYLSRPAYDAKSFGVALREGIAPGDAALDYLMPRYVLDDADVRSLIAYLRTLSANASPGVETKTVHFATVVTPGVDPVRKEAMLEVLRGCFAERTPRVMMPGMRTWTLHVWELDGPESQWPAQLAAHYRAAPVFAMVSGLGAGSWEPVHGFCERKALPCLFANTDLPGARQAGYASFYFNDGVALEARIAGRFFADATEAKRPRRVLQVFRAGDIGAVAARVLAESLAKDGIASEMRPVSADDRRGESLAGVTPQDALVFWLRPADVAGMVEAIDAPPPARVILFSGLLGGPEAASLSAAWRNRSLLIYPLDAPNRRALRMSFNLHPWLLKHRLPTDGDGEALRGNTLAACKLLDDAMARMRGHNVRDYLIESIERPMGNSAATSAYPRFALGVGQRYASKGGYIVRFAQGGSADAALVPETDWIVP